MITYVFTSAQWLIVASALQATECVSDGIFCLSSMERRRHAKERSKKFSYKQITSIHEAVIVAPKFGGRTNSRQNYSGLLLSNLEKASPEKHMPPTSFRCVQRRWNSFFLERSTEFLELEKCASGFPILPKSWIWNCSERLQWRMTASVHVPPPRDCRCDSDRAPTIVYRFKSALFTLPATEDCTCWYGAALNGFNWF